MEFWVPSPYNFDCSMVFNMCIHRQNNNTGYSDQNNSDYFIGTNAKSILVRMTLVS